ELNVREKPTRNSNRVTKIKKGSRYTVLAESNGWYKINVNGKIGWINGEYVKEINPTSQIGKDVEVTANELNVREKPTRNSNRVTKIKKGSRYTVLAESNGWYKINVNGKIGWINGEYVKEINPTSQIGKDVEVTANELNVREKPTRNSNRVTKIKKGSRYTVLAESNGWYKINVNGKIGWINGEYVKEINPTSQIGKDVEVTANELNVREKPTRNSNRVTKIKKGSRYTVLAESNGWYKINVNRKIEWINGE